MHDLTAKRVTLALLERACFAANWRQEHPEFKGASVQALQVMRLAMIEIYRAGWEDASMNRMPKFVIKGQTTFEKEWYEISRYVDLTPKQTTSTLANIDLT